MRLKISSLCTFTFTWLACVLHAIGTACCCAGRLAIVMGTLGCASCITTVGSNAKDTSVVHHASQCWAAPSVWAHQAPSEVHHSPPLPVAYSDWVIYLQADCLIAGRSLSSTSGTTSGIIVTLTGDAVLCLLCSASCCAMLASWRK